MRPLQLMLPAYVAFPMLMPALLQAERVLAPKPLSPTTCHPAPTRFVTDHCLASLTPPLSKPHPALLPLRSPCPSVLVASASAISDLALTHTTMLPGVEVFRTFLPSGHPAHVPLGHTICDAAFDPFPAAGCVLLGDVIRSILFVAKGVISHSVARITFDVLVVYLAPKKLHKPRFLAARAVPPPSGSTPSPSHAPFPSPILP
jgi:hypothetical protein